MILSSPACRALSTVKIISAVLDYQGDIVIDERLYTCDLETLLAVIVELGDQQRCVMLFGHNPELTHRLSREITRMPTCAIVQFTFEAASWLGIASLKPASFKFDYPKRK